MGSLGDNNDLKIDLLLIFNNLLKLIIDILNSHMIDINDKILIKLLNGT